MNLAPSPDNSLLYHFWDIQFAPPYNDASGAFAVGFRGDQIQNFRWLAIKDDRPEAKLVPIMVHFLFGPPCAWISQQEGNWSKISNLVKLRLPYNRVG